MSTKKPKVIIIIGPTASGKSALAIQIAKKFNGEIISADSRQVYRDLNIGSGKVSKREMAGIKHHLLDIISPKKVFTASLFKTAAEQALHDIEGRGKIPIIAGGTGFYLDTIIYNLSLPNVSPDQTLRKKLETKNTAELFDLLKKLDAGRAGTIDRANRPRLIRAIEIARALGKVPTLKQRLSPKYDFLLIGLNPKAEDLSQKIAKRLDLRLKQGLVAEVKNLRQKKISWQRLYDLGLEYRYISLYLRGKIDKKTMVETLEKEINRYAKRQLTWFKKYKQTHWISKPNEALILVKNFLQS